MFPSLYLCLLILAQGAASSVGFKNVAYFTNWSIYARKFDPQDIPIESLTHVLYAFADVHPESGEVYLSDSWSDIEKRYSTDSWGETGNNVYGCIKQLFLHKKKNRKLKTLLSVGGWTFSSHFAQPASTNVGRAKFASSALTLVTNLGFDGLDVDWEYPQNKKQAADFVSLLEEIRKQFDDYSTRIVSGQRLLLSVAAPAGPTNYEILDLAAMDKYLDFWNLMTYDYAVSTNGIATHNANWFPSSQLPKSTPFSSNWTITAYNNAGILASKIVVGMPLYGRSFTNTDGPGTSYSGVTSGTWETGIYDYKVLPLSDTMVFVDIASEASWSYDTSQRTMISFDTPEITVGKASLIKNEGLGGAMWWEASSDKSGAESLLSAYVQAIGGTDALEQHDNILDYPVSIYDNIRAGMP